jgi:hypothetical protein
MVGWVAGPPKAAVVVPPHLKMTKMAEICLIKTVEIMEALKTLISHHREVPLKLVRVEVQAIINSLQHRMMAIKVRLHHKAQEDNHHIISPHKEISRIHHKVEVHKVSHLRVMEATEATKFLKVEVA